MKSRTIRKATALTALMLVGMMLCPGCYYVPRAEIEACKTYWGNWADSPGGECVPGDRHECPYERCVKVTASTSAS